MKDRDERENRNYEYPPIPQGELGVPVMTNSKSSLSSTDSNQKCSSSEFPQNFDNVSMIKPVEENSNKNKGPAIIDPNIHSADYVSFHPSALFLKTDRLLPNFDEPESVMNYFNPFMITEWLEQSSRPATNLIQMKQMVDFVIQIAKRVIQIYPIHKVYYQDIIESSAEMYDLAVAEQFEANFNLPNVQTASWKLAQKDLSFPPKRISSDRSKSRNQDPSTLTSNPGGGDNNDNSSSDSSKSSTSSRQRRNKKKLRKNNKNNKRNKKKRYDDSSLSELDSEDEDKVYRQIVSSLNKNNTKYYKIKEMKKIHSDPSF